MPTFTTEYYDVLNDITTAGPYIDADSFEHAQVRLEFAVALNIVDEGVEIIGELVQQTDCPGL